MTGTDGAEGARLLVITDLDRLGPIVRDCFAPNPISGVRSYLAGIAELPRSPTRAVLVGYDDQCRNPEAAISAIKEAAGETVPVVFCCEPAYEYIGRRLLQHGADDYVIFPPEAVDLERALRMPSRETQRRWLETPLTAPIPSAEELAGLADLLPRLADDDPMVLDAMAALVCGALSAEVVTVSVDWKLGRAGRQDLDGDEAILVEPITRGEQRVGQIRVGKRLTGSFTHEDTAKLRHYGVLFGRLLEGARRTDQWRQLALTDDLTGLPNRRRLMQFLDEKIAWAERENATVTVLLFDIDDFKRYNDSYGHEAGDEILTEVGRLFVQCSRKDDMVARLGGDEFVVVFWDPEGPRTVGSQHPEQVIDVLQRFRKALKGHRFTRLGPEATGRLTISGGIAHYPWQATKCMELIEAADRALFQAKEAGKDRFWIVGEGGIGVQEP
ncbi:MAG: GGDEF domain-containing protein [Phycisphaerales bacterium]|nr:GGDEF domain-containing protein [Phycisphaerales bacterium]